MPTSSQLAPDSPAMTVIDPAHPQEARQSLYMLHGIFGRGRNLAALARQVVAARANWRCALIDLPGHGDSPSGLLHTLPEVAGALAQLVRNAGLRPDAVLGHSFGGKVALAYGATAPAGLRQIWMIESTPAARAPGGSAWEMLLAARRLAGPFDSREAAAAALQAEGFSPAMAAWMASNVVRTADGYRWRLDFDVMERLLRDFFDRDLWHVIDTPPPGVIIHVVKAEDSTLLDSDAIARIDAAARSHNRVQLHRLPGGHWLHTDNPQGLVKLLVAGLPS